MNEGRRCDGCGWVDGLYAAIGRGRHRPVAGVEEAAEEPPDEEDER